MADISSVPPTPESWTSPRGIARLVMAFLLAQAIWGFLVSLTNDALLPWLTGAMGNGTASSLPAKGAAEGDALISSVVELFLAGLLAAALAYWSGSRRKVKVVRRIVRTSQPGAPVQKPLTAPSVSAEGPSETAKPAAASAPAKPQPPKDVMYNIVGEPISPAEDD